MQKKNAKAKITRDNSTNVIAELFNVSPSYVSKVINDTKHLHYKGTTPMAIRQAYLKYKNGTQKILKQLQQFKQAA